MSRCLIALLLVSLFPATALAWGLEGILGERITDTSSRPISITDPSSRLRLGKQWTLPFSASIGSRATPPFANTSCGDAPATDVLSFDLASRCEGAYAGRPPGGVNDAPHTI